MQGIQGVRFVSGPDEARASATYSSGQMMFMDSNRPIFYVTRNTGMFGTELRCFRFEECPEPKPVEYVTKEEFEELRKRYESVVAKLESTQSNVPTAAVHAVNQPAASSAASPANASFGTGYATTVQ